MALVIKDRVQETTTTTSTGSYSLAGAKAGFQSFSVIGDGNTCYYACTDGTDFEIGVGTYTSSNSTLARTTILESSNSDAAVNWGAGSKDIFVTAPADKLLLSDDVNFTRVSSTNSGSATIRYLKIATIDTSSPDTSNSTFVFRILLEGRSTFSGSAQFRVHIRTAESTSHTFVVVEQEHTNSHDHYGPDSFIFDRSPQSGSVLYLKLPNNDDTAWQECFAKLEVAADQDTAYISGHDAVTIHTGQSWMSSISTGIPITASWIDKKFKNVETTGTIRANSSIILTDTNSQIYRPMSGTIGFSAGGSERARVNSSGLDVSGNITVSGSVDGRDIATNIPSSLGTAGQVLTVNAGASAAEWADASGGGGSSTTRAHVVAFANMLG